METESDERLSDELAGPGEGDRDPAQSSSAPKRAGDTSDSSTPKPQDKSLPPSHKKSSTPFEPTFAQKQGAVRLRMEILRRLEAIRVRNRKAQQ